MKIHPNVQGITINFGQLRHFIHVMDLAEGHIAALNYSKPGLNIYNLGTGKGVSVMELVNTFKKINAEYLVSCIVYR